MRYLVWHCGYANILLKKIKYKHLQHLGIKPWEHKATNRAIGIVPDHVCIYAKCLVLLYSDDASAPAATQKILQGMLSVLDLAPSQIMRATILSADCTLAIKQKIQQWAPRFILQLSMEVPAYNSVNCVQTYSPLFLAQNAQYKPQAYKSLLTLRAMLHGTSKFNS